MEINNCLHCGAPSYKYNEGGLYYYGCSKCNVRTHVFETGSYYEKRYLKDWNNKADIKQGELCF